MSKHSLGSLTDAAICVLVAKRKAKLHAKILSNHQHLKDIEAQIETMTAQTNAGLLSELKLLAQAWANKLLEVNVIPANVTPTVSARTFTLYHKLETTTRVGLLSVDWHEMTNGRYEVENASGHLSQPVTGASIPNLLKWVNLQSEVENLKKELVIARAQSHDTIKDLGALPDYEAALKLAAAKKRMKSKKGRALVKALKKSV